MSTAAATLTAPTFAEVRPGTRPAHTPPLTATPAAHVVSPVAERDLDITGAPVGNEGDGLWLDITILSRTVRHVATDA